MINVAEVITDPDFAQPFTVVRSYGDFGAGGWIEGVAPTSGDSLIINGDMELDDNWDDYGIPIVNEQSSTQYHGESGYSRKFTVDSAYAGIRSDPFPVIAGLAYILTFWAYLEDWTDLGIGLRCGDDSGWENIPWITGLTKNAWNEVVRNFSPTVTGPLAYIVFYDDAHGSGTTYIDDVSIFQFASPLTMTGVVTVPDEKELEQMPEADRVKGIMAFYATQALYITHADGTPGTSDKILWRGDYYRLTNCRNYADYGYWKAIGVRIEGA